MAYFRCMASGTGTGATITVSYESEVYGQTLTCTDGTHTYTKTAASSGSTVFTVPNGGTWTISVVMYGHTYSQQVIVVSEYTCTLELWSATVNISTTATELYSQTITVKKGGSTIGSTAFDSSGSATYIAPEEGTYTFECTYSGQTYSASVNVTEETTYSVVISMDLDLSNWLTAGGLDPSDYADLSEVLADEEAVRRLMTIHDSVDYLATASAGDQMMETIIADDICAKWINLRDYALDTLYANSDIADEMDDAGKYFLGEWVITDNTTTPPTWGAKGNVPIMTSNTAPYGEAVASSAYSASYPAYYAFLDKSDFGNEKFWAKSGNDSVGRIGYKFTNPVCVQKVSWDNGANGNDALKVKVVASNDGTNWVDVSDEFEPTIGVNKHTEYSFENTDFYLYWGIRGISYKQSKNWNVCHLQFYGREMKISQATQPTDGREYILIGSTYYTEEWGEYDWDSTTPRKYLYDHGVELETITLSGTATKEPDDIKLSAASSDATATLDTTDYDLLRAVVGKYASGTNVLKAGSGSATFTVGNMPYNQSLDVSNINGSNAVGVGQTSTGIFTAEEWWLE